MTDLLEHEVESTGLDNYWMRQKGRARLKARPSVATVSVFG